jgi:hypothetical protein
MVNKKTIAVVIAIIVIVALTFVWAFGLFSSDSGDNNVTEQEPNSNSSDGGDNETLSETLDSDNSVDDNETVNINDFLDLGIDDSDLAEGVTPVSGTTGLNPSINHLLEMDELERNTLTAIQQATNFHYVFGVRNRGDADDNGLVSTIIKYDGNSEMGQYRLVWGDNDYKRGFASSDRLIEQEIAYTDGEISSIENTTVESPGQSDIFQFGDALEYLSHGGFEPVGRTDVDGQELYLLEATLVNDRDQLLELLPDDAQSFIGYGGQAVVDGAGVLRSAQMTVLYESEGGEERAQHIRVELGFPDEITVTEPGWVDTVGEDAMTTGEEVSLVDAEYLVITPQERSIPEGSKLDVQTATEQSTVTLPAVEQGESLYVYLEDGDFAHSFSPPDPEQALGPDYSVVVSDSSGELILTGSD